MHHFPVKISPMKPAILLACACALTLSSCVTPPPPAPGPPFPQNPPRYGYGSTGSPSYPPQDPRSVPGSTEKPPTIVRDPRDTNVDLTPPPPRNPGPTGSTLPPVTGSPTEITPPVESPAPTPKPAVREDLPYGIPVVGKKGMVYSPYAPEKGQVDVDGYKRGTRVECPYTSKHFRVP
jgi:hypothetical protein